MFALESLAIAGETHENSAAVRRACDFLVSKQMDDGGWGETYMVSPSFHLHLFTPHHVSPFILSSRPQSRDNSFSLPISPLTCFNTSLLVKLATTELTRSHAYQWNTPNILNLKSSKLPGQSWLSYTVNTQMLKLSRKHVDCWWNDRRKMGGGNRRIQRGYLIRIALLIILVRWVFLLYLDILDTVPLLLLCTKSTPVLTPRYLSVFQYLWILDPRTGVARYSSWHVAFKFIFCIWALGKADKYLNQL